MSKISEKSTSVLCGDKTIPMIMASYDFLFVFNSTAPPGYAYGFDRFM